MEKTLLQLFDSVQQFYKQSLRNKAIIYGASLLSVLSLRYLYCKIHRKIKSLPPGPAGIPIFGSLFAFGLNQRNFLSQRSKKDGEISCFYFSAFAKPILLLNTSQTARDILSHKSALDRERRTDAVLLNFQDPQAFGDINGDEWRARRKIFQRQLLSSMNNNKCFEKYTKHNIGLFFKSIDDEKTDVIYPQKDYNYIAFMNVYQNTFGGFIEKTSAVSKELNETIYHFPLVLGVFIVLQSNINLPLWALKWLDKKLDYTACFLKQWQNFNWSLDKFIGYKADVNANQFISNSEDAKNKVLNKKDSECVYSEYLIKQCSANNAYVDCRKAMCDLTLTLVAGVHTVSITSNYMTYILSKNIDIQDKIYSELMRNQNEDYIDNGYRFFKMRDIAKMSILRAFVHECIRLPSVVITSVPRILAHDIKYKNYILPKGSTVFTNMDSCNTYKWGTYGNKLDLSHWLDKDNKFVYNNNLTTFGFGERECAGKIFAIKSLLYLCANMVLNYKIYPYNNDYQCDFEYAGFIKIMTDPGFKFEKRSV
eukprot:545808_1